jgi:hypothetical protein
VTDDDLRTNAAALCLRGFTQEPLREPLCIAVYRQHGQTIANHPGDRVYAHARASRGRLQPQAARSTVDAATRYRRTSNLEPLAEVEGALLVVEVLHAPHPELGGLLLVGSEHFCTRQATSELGLSALSCARPQTPTFADATRAPVQARPRPFASLTAGRRGARPAFGLAGPSAWPMEGPRLPRARAQPCRSRAQDRHARRHLTHHGHTAL